VAIVSLYEMADCIRTKRPVTDCPAAAYRRGAKKRALQPVTAYTESFKPMRLIRQAQDRMPAVVQTAGISVCTASYNFAEPWRKAGAVRPWCRSGAAVVTQRCCRRVGSERCAVFLEPHPVFLFIG
jgi:hypothetical protein